jgi:hypothetical protein
LARLAAGVALVMTLGAFSSAGAARGGQTRPFHVHGVNTFGLGTMFSQGTADGTYIVHGTTSGSFTLTGPISACGASAGPHNTEGSNTFTTADGATITAATSGNTCQSGPTTFAGTATYTITGGTGRFTGVTGRGTVVTHTTFPNGVTNPGTTTYADDGTIRFPAPTPRRRAQSRKHP